MEQLTKAAEVISWSCKAMEELMQAQSRKREEAENRNYLKENSKVQKGRNEVDRNKTGFGEDREMRRFGTEEEFSRTY